MVYTTWDPNYSNILSYRYSYDALGNIIKIEDVTNAARTLAEYTYDELNQLTQEKIYNYTGTSATPASIDTYVYTYDSAGNILTEKKNGTVVNAYTYSTGPWADQLVAVNGEEITYDGSGNPEMYYSANGIDYDFYWTEGRQLAWLEGWGEVPFRAEYEYDADGIRIAKSTETITGVNTEHTYVTQNGKVVRDTIGTGATAKVLDFIYDNSGKPFALTYTDGTAEPQRYYYVLNIQGDVIALMTASREIVARYTYNAWGKVLSVTDEDGEAITSASHIANLNPIRYRGYYYDTETGFYYLQSRYYDPANHRFINADILVSTGQGLIGTNMFVYCNNNPIAYRDSGGTEPVETIDLDGDGENDCYIYEYSWTYYIPVYNTRIGNVLYVPAGTITGYVCFVVGKQEEYFDNNDLDIPEKYSNCVIVGDLRSEHESNPCMQLYNSYMYTDAMQRSAIIYTMLKYDREYPTDPPWGRTEKSLGIEWILHNLAHRALGYEAARSTDFDFKEEGWGIFDYIRKWINREKAKYNDK